MKIYQQNGVEILQNLAAIFQLQLEEFERTDGRVSYTFEYKSRTYTCHAYFDVPEITLQLWFALRKPYTFDRWRAAIELCNECNEKFGTVTFLYEHDVPSDLLFIHETIWCVSPTETYFQKFIDILYDYLDLFADCWEKRTALLEQESETYEKNKAKIKQNEKES
ncbi:MAG: hypothetical protein MJZ89_03905 [Paludibacteraceae bacterium]|nr:hypothetical protein [Paludibacteraceae bacterium]